MRGRCTSTGHCWAGHYISLLRWNREQFWHNLLPLGSLFFEVIRHHTTSPATPASAGNPRADRKLCKLYKNKFPMAPSSCSRWPINRQFSCYAVCAGIKVANRIVGFTIEAQRYTTYKQYHRGINSTAEEQRYSRGTEVQQRYKSIAVYGEPSRCWSVRLFHGGVGHYTFIA